MRLVKILVYDEACKGYAPGHHGKDWAKLTFAIAEPRETNINPDHIVQILDSGSGFLYIQLVKTSGSDSTFHVKMTISEAKALFES